MNDTERSIIEVVKQIPEGKVATYGQVAMLAGLPRRARYVGQVLSRLNESAIPWHRVINAQGKISPRPSGMQDYQRILLEEEGIRFDEKGRLSLKQYAMR